MSRRKDAEPSPKFDVEDASIPANDRIVVDPEPQARASKYKPFDGLTIQNTSNEDLKILLNQQKDNYIILESGQTLNEEFPDIQPFSSFTVINLGSNQVADTDLRINYYKTGVGADKKANQEASANPINKFVENFTGVNPGWL